VAHTVIFPHQPKNEWDESLAVLARLCAEHQVELLPLVMVRPRVKLTNSLPNSSKNTLNLNLTKIVVSEAGASVYSASALAAEEFPN
jgi:uncharacterized protein